MQIIRTNAISREAQCRPSARSLAWTILVRRKNSMLPCGRGHPACNSVNEAIHDHWNFCIPSSCGSYMAADIELATG